MKRKYAEFIRIRLQTHEIIWESELEIGHVRYINILTWLRGFRVKIVDF